MPLGFPFSPVAGIGWSTDAGACGDGAANAPQASQATKIPDNI
jgi:hypothetical protein